MRIKEQFQISPPFHKTSFYLLALSIGFSSIGMVITETNRCLIHRYRLEQYPELKVVVPIWLIIGIISFWFAHLFKHWSLLKKKGIFFCIGCISLISLMLKLGMIDAMINEVRYPDSSNMGYIWFVDISIGTIQAGIGFIFLSYLILMTYKEYKKTHSS